VVSTWDQIADMIATLAVASFAWISSVVGPIGPANQAAPVSASTLDQNQLGSVMRWAQQEEPPIEQVGEGTNEDVETLDEEAAPVNESAPARDDELLDEDPPVDTQNDVELLDQGRPHAPVAETTVPSVVRTEPVTTSVAPAATTGPVVPEGFGTGSVHVATGAAGFPVGLSDCHVGAVTGRAYVGINCGDSGGSSFVGHALSFEEFPFVIDENFPFNRESVFADRSVETLFSAARSAPADFDAFAPEIGTTGAATVEFEQRARGRNPRVEAENGREKRGKDSRRGKTANGASSESDDRGDQASAESKQKAKKRGKDRNGAGSAEDAEKKSKSSKHTKKHGGKNGKKSQTLN
jgi:hypothetical protein